MSRLLDIASQLAGADVAVVGDMIADRYVYGRPTKLSREAPVIVLRYEQERLVPGSAANTVNNLCRLGASARALGIVGQDALGERLVDLLGEAGADVSGMARASCDTIEKTRILAGDIHTAKQQVIRIDRDRDFSPEASSQEALCTALRSLPSSCGVVVVSDYGYRTVTEGAVEAIRSLAGERALIVDSHDRLEAFPGAWMVTPNEGEAERALGRSIRTGKDALSAGRALRSRLGAQHLLLTRGNQGMLLVSEAGEVEIPIAGSEEITDVSGAGDTVVAVLAAARSVGASAAEAARLANVAAGVVVMKRGTATCSPEELRDALLRREARGSRAPGEKPDVER